VKRRYSYDDDFYPSSQPIPTDKGIKARSKRGDFAENWWARRWIEALEALITPGRLARGRSYARKGQVLSIEETKNGVKAKVQGSRSRPYTVTLKLEPLTNSQWEQVTEAMAEQALFSAQLLAGEMPQNIEEAFAMAGVSLFPEHEAELMTQCSCPDPENPCKHIAAVHYILGERFDEDPFMLFRLRGRSQEQIMSALRSRRTEAVEIEEAGPDDPLEDTAQPLAESLAGFWDMGRPLNQFKTTIKPPAAELPVLKRLGQPSFLPADLTELLGPAYRAITERAVATAFEDEPEGDEVDEAEP
jgi:uncharacterized Zn finger protein